MSPVEIFLVSYIVATYLDKHRYLYQLENSEKVLELMVPVSIYRLQEHVKFLKWCFIEDYELNKYIEGKRLFISSRIIHTKTDKEAFVVISIKR